MIVLLSGWSRSGKDATASLLMEEHGFRRFAFGDALKADVAEKTGLPLEQFHGPKDRPIYVRGTTTPRDLLIKHAKEARDTDPDIYARRVAAEIAFVDCPKIVISDWRYRNEFDFLSSTFPDRQIVRVRVDRRYVVQGTDPSEHDLDDEPMDAVLKNNGSIADLRDNLTLLLRSL
jgi:dephospho-CoA kinase